MSDETMAESPEDKVEELEDDNPGVRCEVKGLLLRTKKGEVEITEKNAKSSNEDPYAKYALVSKQAFDENHKLTGTTLEINSPLILAALKDVVTYYPGESLDFHTKFTIEDPYMMLVHHRDALRKYREVIDDSTTKMHVALLLDYLKDEAGTKGVEIDEQIDSGLVTFPLLWMIFKPGDLVCQYLNGHTRLFQVKRHGYGETRNGGKYFELSCSFVSYDGVKVGIAGDKLRIWDRKVNGVSFSTCFRAKLEFFGLFPTSIKSLSAFPLKFLSETEKKDTEDAMAERGLRYLKVKDMCVKQYDGLFLYLRRPPWDFYNEEADYDGVFLPETMSGRIVIDPKTFNEEARAKKEEISSDDENDDDKDKDKEDKKPSTLEVLQTDLEDELDPRLCPSYVYGFSFEKKEWCKFFVDNLSEPDWKPDALDSLILPGPQKRLLQGLITGHKFPDKARNEHGLKGKGLVILLHGAPGTGKTLTAEMTAEHTHRALLNISTGELGSYQHRIEYELKRLLTYASTFQAIVLIDEADVFLEARKSGPADQLAQNAMVAVFLRQLEYFQGIIFLTSNRVSVFDQAIKSRIHLALQYSSPSKAVRRMLWQKHLAHVPADEVDIDLEEALDWVQETEMNGREISNSITTALTLAKSEGEKLKLEFLQTIVQVWAQFEDSLTSLPKEEVEAAEKFTVQGGH